MNDLYMIAGCVFVSAVVFYNIGVARGFGICSELFCKFLEEVDVLLAEAEEEQEQ